MKKLLQNLLMFQTLFTSNFGAPKMVAVPIILKSCKTHWKEIVTAIALPFVFSNNNIKAGLITVGNRSSSVWPGELYIQHVDGATEGDDGNYDLPYLESPNPLHIYSHNNNGIDYSVDTRPADSTTTYDLHLKNTGFSGTADNFLRFKLLDNTNFEWKNIFLGDANDSDNIVADIKNIIYNGDISPTGKPYGDFPLPKVDGSNVGVYDKRKVFFFNYTDFNRDRHINGLDFEIFRENYGGNNETDPNTFGDYVGSEPNNFNAYADINRSGTVDFDDLDIFKTYFRFPGDISLDGRVDNTDFAYFAPYWGATDVNSVADISGPNGIPDKNVDYWDLGAFSDDYLRDINEPNTWSRVR
jgi:hypothetical protein